MIYKMYFWLNVIIADVLIILFTCYLNCITICIYKLCLRCIYFRVYHFCLSKILICSSYNAFTPAPKVLEKTIT